MRRRLPTVVIALDRSFRVSRTNAIPVVGVIPESLVSLNAFLQELSDLTALNPDLESGLARGLAHALETATEGLDRRFKTATASVSVTMSLDPDTNSMKCVFTIATDVT